MKEHPLFDKIDLHLLKVLHTVLTERSVSKTATRLGMHQPAVSACLKRLRAFSGDPLLVRSGSTMVPTDAGLRMVDASASILRSAEVLFSDARDFVPATSRHVFRIAASDYLAPPFLPLLVSQIKTMAPYAEIEILALTSASDYRAQLASGEADIVVGNWPSPPADMHQAPLFSDDVVCLVSKKHPAARRSWTIDGWLNSEHIAPGATHPGAKGVIDGHLAELGMQRNIVARCSHFGLIPAMVASTLLVLTTGRQYCERFVQTLPVVVVPSPVSFPKMVYYQLWHERTHASTANRWLRERVKSVAADL